MTTLEIVAPAFAAKLAAITPLMDLEVQWPVPRLRCRTYLGDIACPSDLTLSARAVVFKGSKVVVVRQNDGLRHVEPGGGLEPGETLEMAARREVLEETGWTIGVLKPFGVHHFRPLGEPNPAFRYRWGDFLQPLFVAEAVAYNRAAKDMTQIELGSRLTPILSASGRLCSL
ncbi:MAG TPA: NUDIX domain-containing protein [Caulobacteraceae bacterium]|nr:NUDIX domain-containing protein [Caulobacteraceae bacterium]